jgi:glyoxylase-like metal-dependent hydrolase (beta-lactamase superfamily II)
VKGEGLNIHLIMETHAHADHISGAQVLKQAFPKAPVVIGNRIRDVQKQFGALYNLQTPFAPDGHQFDALLDDQQEIHAGSLAIKVLFTPGHTPACASYCIGDTVFTGDALFMPDFGTGRCDFPLGSAADLFDSVQKLYKLADSTRTFTGHDYQPGGRALAYESTIGEHKKSNIHIKASTTKDEFVAFRTKRDATLAVPRLLLPSVQVNICAGHLPPPESNNTRFLKSPITIEMGTFK